MRTPTPLYREIASLVGAHERCHETSNREWRDSHRSTVDYLVKNFMPSGAGIDCGTELLWDKSKPNRLVFTFSYHHMNDGGMYDGWTEHELIVTPSFAGIDLRITGRDRNDVKDFLYEVYYHALHQKVWQEHNGKDWVWRDEYYGSLPQCYDGGGI